MALAPQPRPFTIHQLVLLFTVAAAATRAASSSTHTAACAPRAAPAESPSTSAVCFLRARCATTLYPALCYDSLLPYAAEIHENQVRLARVAADVAAARLHALSARVKAILQHGGPEPPADGEGSAAGGGGRPRPSSSETAALRDCASTISAAASLARQSSAELAKLELDTSTGGGSGSSSREARWEVSNAKTWLSAAMTNEDTCAQGLDEAGATASPAGKETTTGVVTVEQYTSNALALVNGIPM